MARILVIDDDANLLQMVKLMLERVGHQVEISDSGEEGIALAAKNQHELAIIDVMMPGLSGYDVVRRMREDSRTARIPIIILTARSQPMDKHMALEAGANAFLSKPVTSHELTDRVDAVLRAGVNYRVHTGLLTEPIPRSPTPPPRPSSVPPRPPSQLQAIETLEQPAVDFSDALSADTIKGRLPIMTVISLRGGTGSTTIAVNLAFTLVNRGRQVCLVDLSTSSGHIPLHLHLPSPHNWSELVAKGNTFDPRIVNQLLIEHPPSGMAVLPAPAIPGTPTLSTIATQNILQELGSTYSHVVVDAPHLDSASIGALLVARAVVVVMADDLLSIQSTGQFLTALQNLGVEMGRVRVVLNQIRPTRDVPPDTIQKALKRPLSAEIPYTPDHANAIRRGMPLVVSDPEGAYAQAIQQLTRTMTM
ncbi:MAG: response regulator [Anaerolineae bacterium]|nr:response regulator [Anaerolineae bacterium]